MANIIALCGFMGCGKSTVARLLAADGGCFYFDLDDTIEMEEDCSISEIFSSRGERAFRDIEYKYLERIISDYEQFDQTILLSLGGGTQTHSRSAALLKKKCTCIYLKTSVEDIIANLKITGIEHRPLLAACKDDDQLRSTVSRLLEVRAGSYEECCDKVIDIEGMSPEQIASTLRKQCLL